VVVVVTAAVVNHPRSKKRKSVVNTGIKGRNGRIIVAAAAAAAQMNVGLSTDMSCFYLK
jgi:hypothetical protein